ncbi:hypothetical protein FB645_001315 [Coemansia sp. IMI 203386]|nr:hypothetical protein FB645_001315 [Coemansia sp. IMI 203386]
MLSSTSVGLYPDSKQVVLYGGPREAQNAYITGRVAVTVKSIEQIKSLAVTLRPQKQKLFQSQQPMTPDLLLRTTLVTDGQTNPQATCISMDEKSHEWLFNIEVPGATAETVYSREHYVAYELIAEARTQGTWVGASQSKACPIAVKRTPNADSPWAILASEPVSETANWQSKLEITLVTESRIVHDNQPMPVRGVIRPLHKGVSLVRAGFQIVEKIGRKVVLFGGNQNLVYSDVIVDNTIDLPNAGLAHAHRNSAESADAQRLTGRPGLPLTQEISASRSLSIPEAYACIQYDIHRGPIRINHELIFFASVVDSQGSVHNLRLATPMFVLPRIDGQQLNLPRYEDTDTDRLVESSSGCSLQRDADFWSNYVFIDTVGSSSSKNDIPSDTDDGEIEIEIEIDPDDCDHADSSVAYVEPISACPLALEGYQQLCNTDVPPPSYPGAATTVERTFVSANLALPGQGTDSTRRKRKFSPRTLLRQQPQSSLTEASGHSSANNDFVYL